MRLPPGRYFIRLKEDESLYLGIGPTPRIYPLKVPVRVFNRGLRSVWVVERAEDEFVTVSDEDFGPPLKWIKDDENHLLASNEDIEPGKFVFENAWVDGTWMIKAKDSDLLRTKIESSDMPELVFRPADETEAQLFIVEAVEF